MALTNKLTNIANAIREKTGGSDLLTLEEMASAIKDIQSGGGLSDVTVLTGELVLTSRPYDLILNHNLNSIKPFLFIAECKDNSQTTGSSNIIYRTTAYVPNISSKKVITEDNVEHEMSCYSICAIHTYDDKSRQGAGKVEILDSPITSFSSYTVKMWANGFGYGMYYNFATNVPYKYLLLYGEGVGLDDVLS